MSDLPTRLAGALAALDGDHPLLNPFLTGPDDKKRDWLTGYRFAQQLGEIDRAKLRVAIREERERATGGP